MRYPDYVVRDEMSPYNIVRGDTLKLGPYDISLNDGEQITNAAVVLTGNNFKKDITEDIEAVALPLEFNSINTSDFPVGEVLLEIKIFIDDEVQKTVIYGQINVVESLVNKDFEYEEPIQPEP